MFFLYVNGNGLFISVLSHNLSQNYLGSFLRFGSARCLGLETVGSIRGQYGWPGSFVSLRGRIGRLRIRLGESESRVPYDRRTSRSTDKSLSTGNT